jgi:hypothetical protein
MGDVLSPSDREGAGAHGMKLSRHELRAINIQVGTVNSLALVSDFRGLHHAYIVLGLITP